MTRFRVTATTVIEKDSPSLASNALYERIDCDGLPHDVAIEAHEETAAPSIGENHPVALCRHSINNAAQIVSFLTERAKGDEVRIDALRVGELLADAGTNLGAFYELFKRQERLIEEQRVECLNWKEHAKREKMYATRVEDKNSALMLELIDTNNRIAGASKAIEQLLIKSSIDAQRSASFFTDVRRVREQLDPSIVIRPMGATPHEPLVAAGATQ